MNPALDRSPNSVLSSCMCRSCAQADPFNLGQTMPPLGPSGDNLHCDALLTRVYQTGFAMDDVLLFLDTHPSDPDALAYYQQAQTHYSMAVQAYESHCGPLFMTNVTDRNYWDWINDPWPWEGGCI